MAKVTNPKDGRLSKELTKQQERQLEIKTKSLEKDKKALDNLIEFKNLGMELNAAQKQRLDLIDKEAGVLEKEKFLKTEIGSLETKLTKQSLNTNKIKKEAGNLAAIQLASLKKSFKETDMTEESFKSQSALIEQIASGTATIEEIQSSIADLSDDVAKGMREFLEASKENLETEQMGKDVLSQTDSLIGSMGSTIKSFMTNPLTAAFAILMAFNATQQSIADQFGAIGVKEFRNDLATTNAEFTKFGLSAAEAQTATSEIANNFGLSVSSVNC